MTYVVTEPLPPLPRSELHAHPFAAAHSEVVGQYLRGRRTDFGGGTAAEGGDADAVYCRHLVRKSDTAAVGFVVYQTNLDDYQSPIDLGLSIDFVFVSREERRRALSEYFMTALIEEMNARVMGITPPPSEKVICTLWGDAQTRAGEAFLRSLLQRWRSACPAGAEVQKCFSAFDANGPTRPW
jgi:hypothetical protein